jgi:hypothetical protein
MTDRVQWRHLSNEEWQAFRFFVGLVVDEDFDIVNTNLLTGFKRSLPALIQKGLIVRLSANSYALGHEGKRLAMLHKVAPQFNWETQ